MRADPGKMHYSEVLFWPVFVPAGVIVCALLFRSLRLVLYNYRVYRRGGVHAPAMTNDLVSGISCQHSSANVS